MWSVGQGGGSVAGPGPSSMASLLAVRDPAVLLREDLPLPACDLSLIVPKLSGIKVCVCVEGGSSV